MFAKKSKGITLEEIARHTGIPYETVRRNMKAGAFDMGSAVSVAKYLIAGMLTNEGRVGKK